MENQGMEELKKTIELEKKILVLENQTEFR
jgi:hypothetical protein